MSKDDKVREILRIKCPLRNTDACSIQCNKCEWTNQLIRELNAIYNKMLPKVNGEYQCEHVKQNVVSSNCVWCHLTVAEKGLKKQRELRIKVEKHKPKIDEGKLREVIKEINFNKNIDIVTGALKAWLSLSGLRKIAHEIAQKAEEIIK